MKLKLNLLFIALALFFLPTKGISVSMNNAFVSGYKYISINNDISKKIDTWSFLKKNSLYEDLSIYEKKWREAIAIAEEAIAVHPNVTGKEFDAIQTAKADTPEQTKDSYIEKINALISATQTFIAAAPAYNAYAVEKAIAEMIGVKVGENPSSAVEATASVNNLKVAEFNYVNDNYIYDYEPVIGTFGEWTGTATVAGEPAVPNYLDYEHWSGETHAYYEQAANGWGNANGWTIQYTKTAKLPAGDYMLKVAARSSAGTTSLVSCTATESTVTLPNNGAATKGIDLDGNASFEGDNFANNGTGFGWEWRYLPFTLTETTDVTMIFYAEATTQYQWMSIADATLLSKQEIQNIVEIAGTDEMAPEAQVATEIHTEIKLVEGLNTLVFPFETTAEELGATKVLEYDGSSVTAVGLTLNFKEVVPVDGVITLQANTPYAVFVAADTEDLTFGTKNIDPAEDLTVTDNNGKFDFVGTYTDLAKGNDVVDERDYVADAKGFKKAKYDNRVAAYRAYLKKTGLFQTDKVAFNFGGMIVDTEDAFAVLRTKMTRNLKHVHIKVVFSKEPYDYSSLDKYIDLACKDETLKLLSFVKSDLSYDLYFELPKKEGIYTLNVSNTLMDVEKDELDQNDNGIRGEGEDSFTEDFVFGNNELYVVVQSPKTGIKGKNGYTDVVLNDIVGDIPISQFSLVSPSGKETAITKVDYLDHLTPARYRVYYDVMEEDGIYTFTINKGLKSSKGFDMRYDYQSTIELPCADLKPTKFTVLDKNWIVGQKYSIAYQVTNKGTMPANEESVDVLYLSPTINLSNEAIEIYRDMIDVNIQSQESYTRTIEVTIPPCIEGHYYLILKTNVARTINELSFDNNTLVSETLSLSVDWLSEGNNKFTLARGESRLFKVPVTSDKNIEVIDKNGCANMYVGYSVFPDTSNDPKNGSVIILSPDESMTYYLLVFNDVKNQEKSQPCELSIRQFDIDIASVGRENVVKHKTAWIPIEVKGCTDMPVFYLMDGQGKKTKSKKVYAKSESSFYAQFKTEELLVGKYNLLVECDGKTGMVSNAITITQEEALPNIKAKLVLPSNSRIGSTITAYIDYENTGNVDLTAPLFILTGQNGSKYSLDDHEFITDEVHIIGVNEKGVMNALLPGESNRISVKITIPNEHIYSAKYKLKTISEGGDGIDEKFYLQWLDVDPEEKPNCYTEEEWNAYCTRLRNNVGDTWLTFIQALGTVAGMYLSADYIEHDAHFLYSILKETDLQVTAHNSHNIKKITPNTLRDVEAGTLFVWKNGQWNQVVQKSGLFSEWETTENINLVNFSASKNFIISHGWNDDRNGNTKWLAQALEKAESNCNIFGIDWSKKATYPSFWFSLTANRPALEIPNVANQVVDGLCTIFGATIGSLRINNLHLIGHSHGAHLCGMIAHKLNFKPKRLTALDASQQWSHVGWMTYGIFIINADNFMGSGWSSSDVQFLDYYKSSVMAGTNRFKGNNNFILIESDNGFVFDKWSDVATEEKRHGYSIEWFAKSIVNKDLKIGYNLSPDYLKDNWGIGYNESQYHGVIHGTDNRIENFSIREDREISKDKWNYTAPWYGKYLNQEFFNDLSFRNALASTIEYDTVSIDPYYDGNNYLETGTTENVKVKFKNTADNFTIPFNIRENEVRKSVANTLFIANSNKTNEYSIVKNKDGLSEVRTKTPIYLLGYDTSYGDISKDEAKESEANISFNISTELWNKLAGEEKDKDYIYCDLWLIPGSDGAAFRPSYYYGDLDNISAYYILDAPTGTSFNNIKLWKGELYPDNNVIIRERVKVKRPTLECDAGKDRLYILDCHQDYVNVDVNGIVVRDNGKPLSYFWEKNGNVFSHSKTGTIPLGVGRHRLTFRIKVKDENNVKAAYAPTSSVNEATDDVYITVKKGTCDEEEEETKTAWSWDPNEKVGIRGAGGKSCIRQGETMEYVIYFENDSTKAQLAAQTVTVVDTLDTAFNLSTFEFTGSEVANTYIDIPSGKAETTIYTDLRPANDLILKADMKLDIDTRELKVVYSSLDTLTYEPTQDVFAGFLPPNDSSHIGEGHFSYRVKLKNDVPDGYQVKNQAHIFFDYNDEIATNITMHTIDSTAPMSTVDGLPSETEKDSIMVSWSGVDDGAGIKYFDVYCSKNGGSYELWKSHVTEHSAILYGMKGDVYRFISVR